jgi:hypothetical protein
LIPEEIKMSCVSTLVLAVSAVVGQLDESGSTSENLKELQFFVGEWKLEGEDAGQKVTGEMKAEWINDKSFVLARLVSNRADGVQMHSTEIIGWDPLKEEIRSWGFGGLGGYGQLNWKKDGDKWIMTCDQPWIRWNGDKLTGTTVRVRLSDDKYVEEGTYKVGDLVVTMRTVLTRVK